VIVSQSLADRLFAGREVLNRTLWWTDPLWGEPEPRRIVGVVADVDDESVTSARALTVYQPVRQQRFAGRLFVRAAGDPYALVPVVTRTVHDIAASQPVERGATLADVRASTVAPDGLNAMVVSGFAGVALLVAVAGVAGVLAFAVAARTREFGVRLAVGSTPRDLLLGVLGEGAVIAGIGVVAGSLGGILCVALATTALGPMPLPGTGPLLGAAGFVVVAVLLAAWMPAARASRVDVLLALKSE
jgi:ABC-type antimicrobial peptide transport system permease subunit